MSKRTVWHAVLAGALLGASIIAATPTVAVAGDNACGTKENPCPLQKWMRQNMAPANASGDAPALAAALDKAAGFSPDPSWNGSDASKSWDAIAKAGAAAARANDLAGAKAACKKCHDNYKEPYKQKFRTKPIAG